MEPLKVAVVGVGRWGRNHVRVVSDLKLLGYVEECVVVDVDPALAKRVSGIHGVDRYYTDVDDMIARENPDAAVVAVPTALHHQVSLKLIPYMDVLIEKPMAANIEQGLEIVDAAEKNARIVAVGQIERFNPGTVALKEYLSTELKEERPTYIHGQRIGPGPVSTRTLNLGVAHDLMIHDADIVNYLLEDLPHRVYATTLSDRGYPYETEINAILEFKGDLTALIRASWRTSPTLKKRTLIVQTDSTIVSFDYMNQSIVAEKGVIEHATSKAYLDILSAYRARDLVEHKLFTGRDVEPLFLEDKHFLESVAKNTTPLVDAVEGYKALKVVVSALESAAGGRPIEVSWLEPFI